MEKIHYGWWMPTDLSTHGHGIDQLILILHYFMVALFVGWGTFFVITLIRHRKREGHRASYESAHSKLPKFIEVGVVVFEVFLLVGLSFPLWGRYKLDPPSAEEALTIRVVGQQFVWNIHYPGEDKKFGKTNIKFLSDYNPLGIDPDDPASADDFIAVNHFHLPVGKPIITQISSKDVIHSFGVPVLRVKQDATPGMSVPIWFNITRPGVFDVHCSQLCGVGHSLMKGVITAVPVEEFEKWAKEQPRPFKKAAEKPKKDESKG